MKFDILKHDQAGTCIYEVLDAPFTEVDWYDGSVITGNSDDNFKEEDCEDIVNEYILDLTRRTLNEATTTSYSAQPQGEFKVKQDLEDEEADALAIDASSVLAKYMIKEDEGIAIELLMSEGFDDDAAEVAVKRIMEVHGDC